MSAPPERRRLADTLVVAPNLHRRFSGVTATVVALVPRQAVRGAVAATGFGLPALVPRFPLRELLTRGWSRPPGGAPARVWHARRNDEMIVGLLLRDLLRQKWRLVFTSAAQRRHTRFTRALLARMDALVATSPMAAAYLDAPHEIVGHGVDTALFRPAVDKAAAMAALGFPGMIGIGAFGRVRHNKGVDLFVDAALALLPARPDVVAVVGGAIAPEHKAFADALKARIAAAGLADRVAFLGEIDGAKLRAWYAAMTVHCAPARWEGFGLTPLEAMASGTATVATRVGAASLLVDDGTTGLLVPPDDGAALTAALARLLDDRALAADMGRAGRRRAVARFDLEGEVDALAAIYARILARRND
ncbi:MAG: glycosyltransferase family 4 protein [Hyphomicrobiales bacterium]|nr:glycosyltransferase family 4 protein [Hyphomicrobiales bacterium]MDE2016579.1 glycosyltransferase family 4 protein [Hyphomicrobiales bacterium]